ncbi:hypothetical protein SASPL_114649 [Salvia splendens]|uniref:HAT C-terminal dimerisation domain-containing protein n=1 Tax=Salvia splendens TaxID=180675 RepID=A0A8X8Y3R8_SALSN|nr:hypothetical protein SASPL_114649 [Salvia splendens]
MVDEEFCYEIELIPDCHSSSLDQESDAHQEKNDSSNWMGSFLEEADDSKSSLVDDNNHDKATFDDDEFTKMECHSVKMSDDSDLLWDVVGVTDSSSSPSCDKQFGGRRNDADVRNRCMIRSLLQVPAIEDDFVKTKAREERDGVEMLVGVISEMMNLRDISSLLVKLVETKRDVIYSRVVLLLKLILILLVATVSVERVFFGMTFVKNKLRNRMSDQPLNDCLVTFIEKDVFLQVSDDDIVNRFEEMETR